MSDTHQDGQTIRLDLKGRADRVEFVGTVTEIRFDKGIASARIPDKSIGRVEFEGRTYRVSQQHTAAWPAGVWYHGDLLDDDLGEDVDPSEDEDQDDDAEEDEDW